MQIRTSDPPDDPQPAIAISIMAAIVPATHSLMCICFSPVSMSRITHRGAYHPAPAGPRLLAPIAVRASRANSHPYATLSSRMVRPSVRRILTDDPEWVTSLSSPVKGGRITDHWGGGKVYHLESSGGQQ